MTDKERKHASKRLSLHLRHEPEGIGITLASDGWVAVDTLLTALGQHGLPLTRADLDELVASSDKKRFAFDETGTRIRAQQGHSVEVDLALEPLTPPDVLFHGTSERAWLAIANEGLRKMERHHVHLSSDADTARAVGGRHGKPVVLRVDAAEMARDGIVFYRSGNGVWLVDEVASRYLSRV